MSIQSRQITIPSPDEKDVLKALDKRQDADGLRMKRFLAMPDLSRALGSPLNELAERIVALPRFADFDVLKVPEIVRYDLSFDYFNFPANHPARSPSDTYFVDKENILRTHTTVMWAYHLAMDSVKEKIAQGKPVGALCFGKVYRKDEIDRNHMNVFHQMDGWYLCKKSDHVIVLQDLQDVLADVAKSVFGNDVKYRFNTDTFPYTDPSLEMEVWIPAGESNEDGRWVEVLGAGVVRGEVLKNFGVDPNQYNGWAFGFGLERLAIIGMELPDIRLLWSDDERVKKQLKLGQKYKHVSKFPPIIRDISFVVSKDFVPNNYFDLIRDLGGDLVEQVELLDKYENEKKFGADKISYTYRIVYRSTERTLTDEEVNAIQKKVYDETAKQYSAELR